MFLLEDFHFHFMVEQSLSCRILVIFNFIWTWYYLNDETETVYSLSYHLFKIDFRRFVKMRNKQLTSSNNYSYLSTLKHATDKKLICESSSFVFLINLWARSDFGYSYFFSLSLSLGAIAPQWVLSSSFMRFVFLDHTQRHTTVRRTPLDEWSARRRDLYLTTHNHHNRQTDRHAPGGIRTHNLSRRATVDLRLRPRGHWDRHWLQLYKNLKKKNFLYDSILHSFYWFL